METLVYADEVVDRRLARRGAAPPRSRSPSASSTVARQLIEMLSAPFEPERFRDDYREAVLALIERKVAGEEIAIAPAPAPPRRRARPDGGAAGAIAAVGKHGERWDGEDAPARPSAEAQARAAAARTPRSAPRSPRASRDGARRASDRLATLPRQARLHARRPSRAGADGRRAPPARAPRFVIHEHSARRLHWDLRLERDGVLASWALPRGLPLERRRSTTSPRTPRTTRSSTWTSRARSPPGSYGAGTMRIWDRGTYECLKWEPRKVEVALHGERVDGPLRALRDRQRGAAEGLDDPPHGPGRGPRPRADARARSCRCSPAPARCPPTTPAGPTRSSGTACARSPTREPGRLRFESRNLNDITARYPELARLDRALSSHSRDARRRDRRASTRTGGRASARSQPRMHVTSPARARRARRESTPVTLRDLRPALARRPLADGAPLRRAPRGARGARRSTRRALADPAGAARAAAATCSRRARAAASRASIAKRRDSRYEPGRRSGAWVKVKQHASASELVIGGWHERAGRAARADRRAAGGGARRRSGQLRYAGRVGTRLQRARCSTSSRGALAPLARARLAVRARRPAAAARRASSASRALVAEVEFSSGRATGLLRRARPFQGRAPESVAHDGDGGEDEAAGAAASATRSPLRARASPAGASSRSRTSTRCSIRRAGSPSAR